MHIPADPKPVEGLPPSPLKYWDQQHATMSVPLGDEDVIHLQIAGFALQHFINCAW